MFLLNFGRCSLFLTVDRAPCQRELNTPSCLFGPVILKREELKTRPVFICKLYRMPHVIQICDCIKHSCNAFQQYRVRKQVVDLIPKPLLSAFQMSNDNFAISSDVLHQACESKSSRCHSRRDSCRYLIRPNLFRCKKYPPSECAWRVEEIEAGSTDPASAMNTTRIDADTSAMHRAEFRRPSLWRHNPFEADPHAEALSCRPLATR